MSDWKEKILKKAKAISDGVPDVQNGDRKFELKELPSVFQNEAMAAILKKQGHHDYAKQIFTDNSQHLVQGILKSKKMGTLSYQLKIKKPDKDDFYLELNRESNKMKLCWSIGSSFQKLFDIQPESSLILLLSFVISTSLQEFPVTIPSTALAGEFVLSDPAFTFRAALMLKNTDAKIKLLFSDFCV
ncbi:MAG: hypothetical protein PF689_14320 [Deltaproteobacteria bacterium]|jgi:hypothetical protein|nr:hypothetical protein [Deltaproteobacteria bacterium]